MKITIENTNEHKLSSPNKIIVESFSDQLDLNTTIVMISKALLGIGFTDESIMKYFKEISEFDYDD